MQEIVGEDIPIVIKESETKINGKIAVKDFSVYPIDESQAITMQHVFARSTHGISRYNKDNVTPPIMDTGLGELSVNGFILQIYYTIKEEDLLEVSYRGHNGKVVVNGNGTMDNKEINEEDVQIIKDKVKMIVESLGYFLIDKKE